MPKYFNRVITFHIGGEIYDNHTTPEDVINNYTWSFKHYGDSDDHFFIEANHNDTSGKITNATKLPKIHSWKTADTDFFVKL